MSNQKERFSSISTRDSQMAKKEVSNPFALNEQELAQLSQATREFFNICLSDSQVSEQRLDLAA
jgi:hypothetical protein